MSAEKAIRSYAEAFSRSDVDALVDHYAEHTKYVQPFAPELTTPEAIRQFESAMFAGFSDVRLELEWVVSDGDNAAVGTVISAVHTGALSLPDGSAVPATQRAIKIHNAEYVRVDNDGRIIEHRRYADPLELLTQLGVR